MASARSYAELLTHLGDREFVSNHATNSAFLDDMVAYPGAAVQDILQYLWTDNVLATGRLPLPHCDANFSDVTANTLLVSGKQDPIVTRACIAPIQTLVNSDDVSLLESPRRAHGHSWRQPGGKSHLAGGGRLAVGPFR